MSSSRQLRRIAHGSWSIIQSRVIGVKWIYKLKLRSDDEITKYKANLVANEFLQKSEIYFNGVYELVAMLETIRILVAIDSYTRKGKKMLKLDVK